MIDKNSLKIVEGMASTWHYHLSETGSPAKPSICGNDKVFQTSIPLSNWGDISPSHIPTSYCKECDKVYKELK